MKPKKIVIDVAVNTEGAAATDEQRLMALDTYQTARVVMPS